LGNKNIEEVEKVLGEPIFIEFSEYLRKIRTSLLIVSSITIFIILCDLEITAESSLLGLKFNKFENEWIMYGLLAINLYLLIHFAVCSIDSFMEWRVRVTGTRVAHVTTAISAHEEGDYPSDPRQSTLYNWWKGEAGKIGNLKDKFDLIETKLNEIETEIQTNSDEKIPYQNLNNVVHPISAINNVLHDLKRRIEEINKVFESNRIPASLKRFDDWHKLLLKSQNLRWLVIEFSFPLSFGTAAIISLLLR